VSHDKAGVSDIHQEITSESNPRFVLHDSQGFAAGEVDNFKTVTKFIEDRSARPDVKDRLHAIWSVNVNLITKWALILRYHVKVLL
jgi:hypothetical protein